MTPIIPYEIKRLTFNKKNGFILVSFLIVTLLIVQIGISEYQKFRKNRQFFLQLEQNKIEKYITFDQYGGYGFRILFEPSPLIVFFETQKLLKNIESNIDTSEVIGLYDIYKGRSIFSAGEYKDFGSIIYILGSLYMLIMGMINFKNFRFAKIIITPKHIFSSIMTRLTLLNLFFIFLFFVNYSLALLNDIPFTSNETRIFIIFCVHALLFLNFFYGVGVLCFSLFKSNTAFISIILWSILVIILPEVHNIIRLRESYTIPSNESLNLKKISTIMDAEKRIWSEIQKSKGTKQEKENLLKQLALNFWDKTFNENQKKELEFNDIVMGMIKRTEDQSILFPMPFYLYATKEFSGKGYSGYKEFMSYIFSTRTAFIKFYIEKRYNSKSAKIIPFLKNEENIFKALPHFPRNYWIGICITFLYGLITFGFSYIVIIKKLNKKNESLPSPTDEIHRGKMYLILCENEVYRDKLFNHFLNVQDYVCVENIQAEDEEPSISPESFIDYLCRTLEANQDIALENLKYLGYYNLKPSQNAETIKKVFLAVNLAKREHTVVFKDFVKRESREFENQFFALLKHLMGKHYSFIYLSSENLQVNTSMSQNNQNFNFRQVQGLELEDPSTYILR